MSYLHDCLGFQTKVAMLDAAAAGRLTGIPFATVANSREDYPETKETPKGHMDQQQQGVRSTKPNEEWERVDTARTIGKKEQDVYVKVWDLKHTTYSDQTGRFPFSSYAGHRYTMVMVEIDSSYISAAPRLGW